MRLKNCAVVSLPFVNPFFALVARKNFNHLSIYVKFIEKLFNLVENFLTHVWCANQFKIFFSLMCHYLHLSTRTKKWISHSGIDYCGFKLRTWNISSLLRKFHDIAKANDDADDVTDSGSHKKAPHKNFIHHQAIKNIFMYEEAFFNLCAIL